MSRFRRWSFKQAVDGRDGFYSQFGQDQFVAGLVGNAEAGTFLDIGAHDGVSFSNSCFFERELGWTGVCVEPHPDAFGKLQRNRNCVCVNAAVDVAGGISDFLQVVGQGVMLSALVKSIADRDSVDRYATEHGSAVEVIDVECRTVAEILEEAGTPKVTFLSLDIEGGELDVLRSIDLDRFGVRVISVENNEDDKGSIEAYLGKKGYDLAAILACDEIYVRRQEAGES